MLIVRSHNAVPIRLTEERWGHIVRRHPEMATERDKVLETISAPDLIQQGDYEVLLGVRLFPQTPLTRKFLVAAYREVDANDGFLLTAYLTNAPSPKRGVVWKR